MADSRKFGTEVWIALAVYLGLLLLLLVYAAVLRCIRARSTAPKENSLVEHFLAGRNLGPIALGFSVSASMFSGYTVVGLPAEAYSKGFSAWRWVGSCTFITIVYMAYAPRMQWLSRVRGHDSLCYYIKDRYGIAQQHRDPLHWLMVIVLLVPCFIYLCAQFDAFGNTISTLTGGAVTPVIGAVGLAALIAVFEILGGLHVVALTDVVQGVVLVAGAMLILISMDIHFEGLPAISKKLEVLDPSLVQVMDGAQGLSWAEFWIGVGVQRALFPDYPHRAMAASSQKSLRVGMAILALSPFLVQVPLLFFGIIGRVHHPDLENPKEIFTLVVLDIIYSDMFGKVVGSIMMAACLAAIMSTADSVLMVVSQIVTLDIIRPILEAIAAKRSSHSASEVASAPPASPSAASEPGKVPPFAVPAAAAAGTGPPKTGGCLVISSRIVTVIAAGVCIPVVESNIDLSFMIQFQSAIIAQTLPTIVLALYWRGMHKGAAIAGLLVGVSSGVALVGNEVPGGILISLAGNIIATITVACTFPRFAAPTSEKHAEALLHIFWRKPSSSLPIQEFGDVKGLGVAPPPYLEPVKSRWGLMILAMALPWLALPLYRQSGTIDLYLSGSPLWAVTAVVVLLLTHFLLLYIIACHWKDKTEFAYRADLPPSVIGGGSHEGSLVSAGTAGAGGESALAHAAADMFHSHSAHGEHGGSSSEHVASIRGELQELRNEMMKQSSAQSNIMREAVREEINALFA